MKTFLRRSLPIIIILILAAFLRLYRLDHYPVGLNADEAAIGYNAYSLIETGRDEHGVPWPLAFRSFDDYKPPVYFYLTLPFIKVLGLTIWAVRLPSAILGILSVYFLYLLCGQLFGNSKLKNYLEIRNSKLDIGIIASFLLAISPWHLHFSRGGWEVNAATFFLVLGLWAFHKALDSPRYFVLWVLSFVISLYTYHSLRIVSPLLGLYLLIANWKLFENWKLRFWSLASIFFGALLVIPLLFQFISSSGGTARFQGVSIFADPGPLAWVHEMRRTSADPDSLFTKIVYNRYSAYTGAFVANFLSHFSPDFLFIEGDEIARSKVPGFGQAYLWTLPFFAVGLFLLVKNLNPKTGLIFFWILVGALPAALTFQSPHALRAQNLSLPLQIVTAIGISQALAWSRRARGVFLALVLILSITGLTRYLHAYYIRYPRELGFAWQPGFDQLADFLKANQDQYDQIVISTRYDQPYILLAFFLRYPPEQFQRELVFSTPDRFGFSTGLSFGKYAFRPIRESDFLLPDTLVVVADEATPAYRSPLATISYPNGDPVFRLYSTQP